MDGFSQLVSSRRMSATASVASTTCAVVCVGASCPKRETLNFSAFPLLIVGGARTGPVGGTSSYERSCLCPRPSRTRRLLSRRGVCRRHGGRRGCGHPAGPGAWGGWGAAGAPWAGLAVHPVGGSGLGCGPLPGAAVAGSPCPGAGGLAGGAGARAAEPAGWGALAPHSREYGGGPRRLIRLPRPYRHHGVGGRGDGRDGVLCLKPVSQDQLREAIAAAGRTTRAQDARRRQGGAWWRGSVARSRFCRPKP